VADTDTDGDGTPDCNDLCPEDSNKTEPGICGCGVADTDTDDDGVADCNDLCPYDPGKTEPGICGCGVADTDTDDDGVADCNDICPGYNDSVDADGDGTPDGCDGCPEDPNKVSPGACGCGVADTDSDGDGVADCNDGCPSDSSKSSPGDCGCGNSDKDTDGDGTADCNDNCPNDPNKVSPGACGCGVSDKDTDGDGTPDCEDKSPEGGTSGYTGGSADPIANAGGPYFANPGEEIEFNGSLSTDPNGDIVEWFWNFGDGTTGTGEITMHNYTIPGEYIVNLTVTDARGVSDINETFALIIQPNRPPENPTIDGEIIGLPNTNYTYNVRSTDLDNDMIRYFVDWGDGTNATSEFVESGTLYDFIHRWDSVGEFTISVQAYDGKAYSGTTELKHINTGETVIKLKNNYFLLILIIVMIIELTAITIQIQREKLKNKK
ncbi:MAG: PKD domain-containing protein, partial [Thermoplasmatales archaeon]